MTDQEINEAVARKLGWKYTPPPLISEFLPIQWTRPNGETSHYLPDFCRSIQAAWEIVEHLGENYVATLNHNHGVYSCLLSHERVSYDASDARFSGFVEADTAPRAICEAFLKLP